MKILITILFLCSPILAQEQPFKIADGSDKTAGRTTDTAVVGDVAGTISAKMRHFNKILTLTWDNVNNRFNVNIENIPAVTQSGTWNINNIAGIITLPSGASTSALQTTGNSSLSSIDTKTLAAGQATMAASYPVVIASNQSAIPISGTVTATTGGLTDTQLRATPVPISGTITVGTFPDNEPINIAQINGITPLMGNGPTGTGSQRITIADNNSPLAVTGTFFQATQPVSGTVTTTPPANASTNISQINGITPLMGAGNGGTGSLRVNIASDQLKIPVHGIYSNNAAGSGVDNIPVLPAIVNASPPTYVDTRVAALSLATDGGLRVHGVSLTPGTNATHLGKAEDAVSASSDTGVFVLAIRQDSNTVFTNANGDYSPIAVDSYGAIFAMPAHPNRFSCFVQAVTVMTQCQAAPAAGLRNYVTGILVSNQAATVQTIDIVYGTGANCATVPVAITHKFQMGTLALTTSPMFIDAEFSTPLVPIAANAICIRPSAATAFGATITGFIAP